MKNLHDLLHGIASVPANYPIAITDLALDSRQVNAGDLFLAYPGDTSDGRLFIQSAIENGACAVLFDPNPTINLPETNIPCIPVSELKAKLGLIAARFYDHPSKRLSTIAITGTNGKTSISHFCAQALNTLNYPCGVIGTLGNGLLNNLHETKNTTSDPVTLQGILAELKSANAKAVTLEASSHALVQGRLVGTHVDIAIFTNLTRDHLDYHLTMENYGNAKKLLFAFDSLKSRIINIDDAFGKTLFENYKSYPGTVSYSCKEEANFSIIQFEPHPQGMDLVIKTPQGKLPINVPIIGYFNVSNLLAVTATLVAIGFDNSSIQKALEQLTPVAGRMMLYSAKDAPTFVVDYAHTPDALEQALKTLKGHSKKHLYCVFGCGGNRDRGKRPIMGKIAEAYADFIILTDDNPRKEAPEFIIEDIVSGINDKTKLTLIHNRRKAIAHAFEQACPGDIILLAGKGPETYQIYGEEKQAYSDLDEVQKLLDI